MPERTYTSAGDGKLEALEETPFPTENEFQALLAEHPKLLDGEQIRPGDARRWILVTREKGIAPSAGEAARWAVDHLIIDQDAVPTLAEVKRGSNPEIRRTIVGQLLEYAAHASEIWTAEEQRGAFERQAEARGRDAEAELATLLQTDGDPDVDGFWAAVSTNLAAKRLRLLFVADFIATCIARRQAYARSSPGCRAVSCVTLRVRASPVRTAHGRQVQSGVVESVVCADPIHTSGRWLLRLMKRPLA